MFDFLTSSSEARPSRRGVPRLAILLSVTERQSRETIFLLLQPGFAAVSNFLIDFVCLINNEQFHASNFYAIVYTRLPSIKYSELQFAELRNSAAIYSGCNHSIETVASLILIAYVLRI